MSPCCRWMPPCILNIKPEACLVMPAPNMPPKKSIGQGRPAPPGAAVKRVAAKKKEPLKSTKNMEVLSLVEEVVEEASKEMVANAVAPQSHEVQLIPVKKYSQTTEDMEDKHQDKKVEDAVRRRMSSESSDHQRRINRGDSEVKIEEILSRVFEDITTPPKSEKHTPPSKSRSPTKRTTPQKPPIPKNSPRVYPKTTVAENRTRGPVKHPVVKKEVSKTNGQIKPTVTKVELRKAPPKPALPKRMVADPPKTNSVADPVQSQPPRPAPKTETKSAPRPVTPKTASPSVKKAVIGKQEPLQKSK